MCAHSSNWSAKVLLNVQNLDLTYSAPHMCVCVHSSNCRDLQLTYSETHVCMPSAAIGRPTIDPWVQPSLVTSSAAHSSNWSAKVVERSKPSSDFFTDLFCNTCWCVCSQKHLAGQPSIDFFCATHVCARSSSCRELTFSEHTCVCACSGNRSANP